MYDNPFIYKRPLYPEGDELVTIRREVLLAKATSGLAFGHWFTVSGGNKIGKTTFLQAMIYECKKRNLGYQFILIEPEELTSCTPNDISCALGQRISAALPCSQPRSPLNSGTPTGRDQLEEYLAMIANDSQSVERIIVILDSFETVPKALQREILRALIELRRSQSSSKPLTKYQFIVSGMLKSTDFQLQHGRSLSEFAMKVMVEDFKSQDLEVWLERIGEQLQLPCQSGLGRVLYEATSGTAYLAQKICYRILEQCFLREERPELTIKRAEMAIESIIQEGESNIERVIAKIAGKDQLVESLMRVLRAGKISSSRFDPQLKALVAMGALTEHQGVYRVRNRVYETAFRDYFTVERLADRYFSEQKYHRARELVSEAVSQQLTVQHALSALSGNINFIGGEIGRGSLVKSILEAFMHVLDSTKVCSLMIVNKDKGTLGIFDAIGMSTEDILSFELPLGIGVAGWVAQVGRPRFIRDVSDEIESPEFTNRDLAAKLNIAAMASLPLKESGKVTGVINLCLARPREFMPSETKVLEIMAAYASLALQNARLHAEMEQYFYHLEQVRSLMQDAGHRADLEAIFEMVLDTISKIVGTDKVYLVYRRHNTGNWRFKFLSGSPPDVEKLPQVELGHGTAGYVLKNNCPYAVESPQADDHYFALWEGIQWELGVPCSNDQEPQACLLMCCESRPAFSSGKMHLLTMLADIVIMTLRNKRLYDVAIKKTQQVITAHGIGEALSRENSLQEILNLIANECLNLLGREHKIALVWLQDNERGKLILKAVAGETFGRQYLGRTVRIKDKSIVTRVLNSRLSYLARDVRENEVYRQTHAEIMSEMAVPMIFRNEVIGVIDLQSLKLDDFDDQDLDTLMAVAYNASVATKIGELCDIRIKELESLHRIGTKISSSLNVKEVLQAICREGLDVVGLENRNICVQLIDPEKLTPLMRVVQGAHLNGGRPANSCFWSESREFWVVRNKRSHLSEVVTEDPAYVPTSSLIKSAMLVPIVYDGQAVGIITMESSREDDFGESELRLITGLAKQAGVAIENARLSEELRQAQISLSKVLETTAIEEAIAGFTHDIKNFSSMIAGETQWLEKRDRKNRFLVPEARAAIKNIGSYVRKIEDFARELKSRAYQTPQDLSWVDLNEVIEEAIRLVSSKATRQVVDIQQDEPACKVSIYADSGRLIRAFFNIMGNSVDAMAEGGTLRISVQEDLENVRVIFSDTGPGIPEDNLNKVLEPFFTTKKHGYGLGLAITRRLIETDHGGKLIIRSQPGVGTTVEAQLPYDAQAYVRRQARRRLDSEDQLKITAAEGSTSLVHSGHLLVVNDDLSMLDKITQLLRGEGHQVTPTESGRHAVEICRNTEFDMIILDFHLKKDRSPSRTAIDFVPELKQHAPRIPIVLTSATMDHLGAPEMYCDYFLEIDHSFWAKILELTNRCLQAGNGRLVIPMSNGSQSENESSKAVTEGT